MDVGQLISVTRTSNWATKSICISAPRDLHSVSTNRQALRRRYFFVLACPQVFQLKLPGFSTTVTIGFALPSKNRGNKCQENSSDFSV